VICIKEDVSEEVFILDDGTKKLIEYGEANNFRTPDGKISPEIPLTAEIIEKYKLIPLEWNNFSGEGKLSADDMRITIFDNEGNIISQEFKENKYQDEEKLQYLYHKIIIENPDKIF